MYSRGPGPEDTGEQALLLPSRRCGLVVQDTQHRDGLILSVGITCHCGITGREFRV